MEKESRQRRSELIRGIARERGQADRTDLEKGERKSVEKHGERDQFVARLPCTLHTVPLPEHMTISAHLAE